MKAHVHTLAVQAAEKALEEGYRRGFARGQAVGIEKAIKSLVATSAIVLDKHGAGRELIAEFEKEFNAYMNAVIDGRITFDEIIEAKEEELPCE